MSLLEKFKKLSTETAPGQEARATEGNVRSLMRGQKMVGAPVDFSHGDVDAHEPVAEAFKAFSDAVALGGRQAYTEYRGSIDIREHVAREFGAFTGRSVDPRDGTIITPGTQGALFLAAACVISRGDKVAVVQPDYFASRKIVEFLEGEMVPITLNYQDTETGAGGIDLDRLEAAFRDGAKVFIFSNPNNPSGYVYSSAEIESIARLSQRYGVFVIIDQLYSRMTYDGVSYAHLCAADISPENVITVMGPSKTESLSGYRLGVAFGSHTVIGRMEKLQAIVSLRASGYSQAVLRTWFKEPAGWLAERIRRHQAIRDDLIGILRGVDGLSVRSPDAGSYLFPRLPRLAVSPADFVKILRHQADVIVTPGAEFGPNCGDSVRLNFSQDHRAAVGATERLVRLVEEYRMT